MTQPFTVHLKMHPNFGSNQEKKVLKINPPFGLFSTSLFFGKKPNSLEFTGIDIDLS